MKQTFVYGKYSYDYFIEFCSRKSISLVVQPDLRIIIRAPFESKLTDIEKFLVQKWSWLEKQLAEFRKYYKKRYDRQYIAGEAYQYLGRQYILEVEKSIKDKVKLERDAIKIYTTHLTRDSEWNKNLLEEWYDGRRNAIFKSQYIAALKKFGYDTFPQLRIRAMSRRWGSYTSDGKIILNPRLIEASSEAIYYVCIHELCHVISQKHDELFYKNLAARMPNWKVTKEQLEIYHG